MHGVTLHFEDDLAIVRLERVLSFEESKAVLAGIVPRYLGHPVVWDLGDLVLKEWDQQRIRAAIEQAGPILSGAAGAPAAIVARQNVTYGLMRMLTSLSEIASHPVNLAVFRTMAEARSWLSKQPLPDDAKT